MKVDMNLLPEEHRPNRLALPLAIVLIVVILAVGYYGYGFYTKNTEANNEIAELQAKLESINAETQKTIDESPLEDLQVKITQTEEEIAQLEIMELDYETRNKERI